MSISSLSLNSGGGGGVNINNDLSLNNRLFVANDCSLNKNLNVVGNVSCGNVVLSSATPGGININSSLVVSTTVITGLTDVSLNSRLYVNGDTSLNGNLYLGSITERCVNVSNGTSTSVVLDMSKPYSIYYSTSPMTANFAVNIINVPLHVNSNFVKTAGGLNSINTFSLIYYTNGAASTFYGTTLYLQTGSTTGSNGVTDISNTLYFSGGTPYLPTTNNRSNIPFMQSFTIVNNPSYYLGLSDASRIVFTSVNTFI